MQLDISKLENLTIRPPTLDTAFNYLLFRAQIKIGGRVSSFYGYIYRSLICSLVDAGTRCIKRTRGFIRTDTIAN